MVNEIYKCVFARIVPKTVAPSVGYCRMEEDGNKREGGESKRCSVGWYMYISIMPWSTSLLIMLGLSVTR